MKITWKSIYYPIGQWQDESGNEVLKSGNFKCKKDGVNLLCIMKDCKSDAGHGESAIISKVPSFINADTLKYVAIENGSFVEA